MSAQTVDLIVVGSTRAAEMLVSEARRRRASVAWIQCFPEARADEALWRNLVNRTKLLRFSEVSSDLSERIRGELSRAIWNDALAPQSDYQFEYTDEDRAATDVGLRILHGRPRFLEPTRLSLADESPIEANAVFVATGVSPRRPSRFPMDDLVICDYRSMLRSRVPPRSIAIVGADWLGCEWSSVCAAAGAHVTLIDRRSRLLRALDGDLRIALQGRLHRMGVDIVLEEAIVDMRTGRHGVCHLRLSSGREEMVERGLILAGQIGNSAGLGLQEIGVQMDALGHIAIDDSFRSSVPNVFAIGRVADPLGISPSSAFQAQTAVAAALNESSTSRPVTMPWVLQSAVEIASCGLTAEACGKLEIDVLVGKASSREPDAAAAGIAKVIVDRDSGALLGAQISGTGAAEAICHACDGLNREMTLDDFVGSSSVESTSTDLYHQALNSALLQWHGSTKLPAEAPDDIGMF